MRYRIVKMRPEDWPEVSAIYREGIESGEATFETRVPTWAEWDRCHLRDLRLVARLHGQAVGWAAASQVSGRPVYRGVAEASVYVHESFRGRGVGLALLEMLIDASLESGVWTLQAAIFPDNAASLALLRRCGFRLIGYREGIAKLNGVWRDVLLLEHRNPLRSDEPGAVKIKGRTPESVRPTERLYLTA